MNIGLVDSKLCDPPVQVDERLYISEDEILIVPTDDGAISEHRAQGQVP